MNIKSKAVIGTLLLVVLIFILFKKNVSTIKISINSNSLESVPKPVPPPEYLILKPTSRAAVNGRCRLDKVARYLHTSKDYCEKTGNVYLTKTELDHGMFEEGYLRAMCHRGVNIVEIGSFDGQEARIAASLGCNVRVFEPSPPNRDKLFATTSNLTEQQQKRIDVRPVAIGREKGTLHFRAFGTPVDGFAEESENTIKVDVLPLSLGIQDIEVVDLLKIDTEGYEIDIMNASMDILHPSKFKHITFEFSPSRIPHEFPWEMVNSTFNHLRSVGYHLYLLSANSLPPAVLRKKKCRVPQYLPSCLPNAMHVGLASPAATRHLGIWTNLVATSSPQNLANLKTVDDVKQLFSVIN